MMATKSKQGVVKGTSVKFTDRWYVVVDARGKAVDLDGHLFVYTTRKAARAALEAGEKVVRLADCWGIVQ
jgi:hypothetical protein